MSDEELEIYKFCWDCGKHGCVASVFLAKPSEILDLIGQTIDLGSIFGKHSDVSGIMESTDITKIECTARFANECLEVFGDTICGPNPFDNIYISDEEE